MSVYLAILVRLVDWFVRYWFGLSVDKIAGWSINFSSWFGDFGFRVSGSSIFYRPDGTAYTYGIKVHALCIASELSRCVNKPHANLVDTASNVLPGRLSRLFTSI